MSLDTKEGAWRLGARRRHGTVEVGDLVPLPQRLVVGRVTNHVPAVRRKADRDCAEGTEGAEGAKRAGNGVSRGRVDNGQRGGFGGDRGRGVCVNPGQNWAGNGCQCLSVLGITFSPCCTRQDSQGSRPTPTRPKTDWPVMSTGAPPYTVLKSPHTLCSKRV